MSKTEDAYELAVERRIAAPPAILWRAWTERFTEWWCPLPWTSRIIENDLRPGGRSCIEMNGPNGEQHAHEGVYLEVVPERSVVVTDAFGAGWVPQKPFMIGLFRMAPDGDGTLYRASARHWDAETMKQHEAMGFDEGWGKAADQLAAIAEKMARER